MISFEEAQALVLARVKSLESEKIPILDALGRVLANEIAAPRDVPHEDNSAMDGFAVRHEDIKGSSGSSGMRLTVVGESRAGKPFGGSISRGETVRIMTGAVIPQGADTVVMSEYTFAGEGDVVVFRDPGKGANIRFRGEYIACGETVLRSGETIGASEIGILAASGYAKIKVCKRPVVAVLSTGDELVDLCSPLGPGQIFSSNAYSLAAQILECGAVPLSLGIASDDEDELVGKLQEGLAAADVVVTSGGVSEGRHDLVKQSLVRIGMKIVFWKVAMKPGKPVLFGTVEQKPIFGLPGNPGAATICFEQFVRPAVLKMMGHKRLMRPQSQAILAGQAISPSDRLCFLRCRLEEERGRLTARLIPKLGVGLHRSSFSTDGLIVIPPGKSFIKPGDTVVVQILRWPLSVSN
ncbi:MAG: molybdopterin molybdotransferase [Thermodesulfobacteriota bacterium]|nr:molybdopterin molybdotransferase [Thermodesulfobacteriota bacterium]